MEITWASKHLEVKQDLSEKMNFQHREEISSIYYTWEDSDGDKESIRETKSFSAAVCVSGGLIVVSKVL